MAAFPSYRWTDVAGPALSNTSRWWGIPACADGAPRRRLISTDVPVPREVAFIPTSQALLSDAENSRGSEPGRPRTAPVSPHGLHRSLWKPCGEPAPAVEHHT